MCAALTIILDSEILQSAEREAKARHTTLADVIASQLRVMARNWQDSLAGKTPVTDALRGVLKVEPDFDGKAILAGELLKKHSTQAES